MRLCSLLRTSLSTVITGAVMAESSHKTVKTYEQTVEALNMLQTNAQSIAESKKSKDKDYGERKLTENVLFLNRIGIKVEDIDALNPIHIAGTKGKGSVCAMCESILRNHGYKTGFLSSPHLLEVRERIRINGVPISKEMFTKHFWECHEKLSETAKDYERKMPPYYAFLNSMSFKVFLEEKVDVAIVEVGIGGAYDGTNIIRHPKVCGISSLGFDHVELLGKTIKEIAWHKAGIFKPGVPGFTTLQPSEGLEMIRERAKELQLSSLMVSPNYLSYPNPVLDLGIHGEHQFENASLAAQICKTWLDDKSNGMGNLADLSISSSEITKTTIEAPKTRSGDRNVAEEQERNTECGIRVAEPFRFSPSFLKGLEDCKWPGRCQVIRQEGISYFVDGAHTNKSLRYCAKWFTKASADDATRHKDLTVIRVLLFNFSGERDAEFLMQPLLPLEFNYSLFCPNVIEANSTKSSDQTNFKAMKKNLLARCQTNAELWKHLHDQNDSFSRLTDEPIVLNSTSESVQWVKKIVSPGTTHVQVLVCGSLYLVGGVLASLGYDTDTLLQSKRIEQMNLSVASVHI